MNALLPASATQLDNRKSILAPGRILQDRYRIVRQLGKGGMGAVYEAIDQRLDATVALKETFSVDDRLRRQFEQEARLLAQLHHPALPRVSDYFTEGDRAFLVMQFISGVDLAEIIVTQPGPFPRNQVIAWADQLLDALVYLHARDRQIIHRDIKPHNLKLTSTGQIALLDFGLAKAQVGDLSATSPVASIFGYTRRYSPLEQMRDEGTSPQSDIYALGATLYHLLTGVKPPDAFLRAAAFANSKPDPLRAADEIHSAVGPEIAEILCRAMALRAEDRYANAGEFREALRGIGRRDPGKTGNSPEFCTVEATGDGPGANTPVMKKARVSSIDPFDSYSILKPAEPAWLIPRYGRRVALFVAMLAIVLAAGVGAFFNYGQWLGTTDSVLNHAKAPQIDHSNAIVHQTKLDTSQTNGPGVKNGLAPAAVENSRKSNPPKSAKRRMGIDIPSPKPPPVVLPFQR